MPIEPKILICDILVNPKLLNISKIARVANLSQSYTSLLINGQRKNQKAQWSVRNAIVSLYGGVITYSITKNR